MQSIWILDGLTVNVKDVGNLSNTDLSVLDNDLNGLKLLDGNILDINKILIDVEVTTLTDFIDKFDIRLTTNDIDVCTLLAVCE